MCGIMGIWSKESIVPQEVETALATLRHRGPDAEAIYFNDDHKVALGHTRLSIIDLSQQANQPMKSADERYIIVFNGEIYNFKEVRKRIETIRPGTVFLTHSDTEVILQAFRIWGIEMVKQLEGMFAIAIFDAIDKKLFLFRDRLGKKPLYYFLNDYYFAFGSEIKALLRNLVVRDAKEVDIHAVHEFVHLGYIPEPKTIFRYIRKFPSGSVGEIGTDFLLNLKHYWRPEDALEEAVDVRNAPGAFRSLLHHAVQQRLISDVPLGTFLSGGTDSSLVTAIAAEYVPGKLKTFSIGFKEKAFDEQQFAKRVAACLRTDHQDYVLEESEAVNMLEKYIEHFDEPFADTSAIPTMLVSKLARKEVKVALTGDGGDELFQGYGSYSWAQRLNNPLLNIFRTPLSFGLQRFGDSRLKRVAHLLQHVNANETRSHIFSQEQYFFSVREIGTKLLRDAPDYIPFSYDDPVLETRHLNEAEKQAFFDLKFYLKDDLLVKVDRASMYYSLECRCPLLDHSVVEFALGLPYEMKQHGKVGKWMLKEQLKEYLPEQLINRQKWGFSIPLSQWLKNDLHYLIDDYLNNEIVDKIGLVKTTYVEELKSRFAKGEDYLYNRIWILIVLHKWMKEHT